MSCKTRFGLVFAVLFLLPAFATARDYVPLEQRLTAEQRQATGLDTLSPEQLALLNQLLRDDRDEVAKVARQEAKTELATAGSQRDPDPSRFIGLADEPITSRVTGEVAGWQPGTEFALENGQVWKVLKGQMKLRAPMQSPQIVVVPGIAGRWFLQVHEDLPKARVYRID